jgi:hypothetical protein
MATLISESDVLSQCLSYLRVKGFWVWRNNTGAARASGGRYVPFGLIGSPDIIGVLPDGRFLGVECKSPSGRQSAAQKDFQRKAEERGALYILARSVDDLTAAGL